MKIVPGNIFGFWMFIVASLVVVYAIRRSEKGTLDVVLRPIPGLEAIEESVGRATEMGRPVHFSPGLGDIIGTSAPETLAALQILSYVTDLSAKYDADLLVTVRMPNVLPLADETVRQGYIAASKADSYKDDTCLLYTSFLLRKLLKDRINVIPSGHNHLVDHVLPLRGNGQSYYSAILGITLALQVRCV